jgi:hypothetical protein
VMICGQLQEAFQDDSINDHGRVLNGRCLGCSPLDVKDTDDGSLPAVSRPTAPGTKEIFPQSVQISHSEEDEEHGAEDLRLCLFWHRT